MAHGHTTERKTTYAIRWGATADKSEELCALLESIRDSASPRV